MKRFTKGIRLFAAAVLALAMAAPAQATTRWRDVHLEIEPERWAPEASFDPETGRMIALLLNPYQTNVQIAAYAPGQSTPAWTRTFAAVPPEAQGQGTSFAGALVVAPQHHLVYVGGGYINGTGSGPFTSAGYIYAFDTRTGEVVWSHADPLQPGMGGVYKELVKGPNGSVIALHGALLLGEPHNSSGSYATEVVSFAPRGRELWRWTDTRNGYIQDITATRSGVMALVGETYPDGWSRGYRVALDMESGKLLWRRVSSSMEFFSAVSATATGRSLYVAGSTTRSDGSDASLRAVSTATGRVRWTRRLQPPRPQIAGDLSYHSAHLVVATRRGPCITGSWDGRRAVTYEAILPDNGFIACYAPTGGRRWLDRDPGAKGSVLVADGGRLLWAGRQEASRMQSSEEILRFSIRSLDGGRVRHRSKFEYRTADYDASDPLLAFAHRDAVHFITALTHARNLDNSIERPPGLLDRVFR